MATVPGDPSATAQPELPKAFQPTMADFLQAAAIMDQKGRMQMAGDVTRLPWYSNRPDFDPKKLATQRTLMRALGGGAKVLPMKPPEPSVEEER